MRKNALRFMAALFVAALTGILSCSSGSGSGCGSTDTSNSTTTQVTCGKGTHQEGNSCVAN